MQMNLLLLPDIARGASLRGNEYGWQIPAFPEALATASSLGFACVSADNSNFAPRTAPMRCIG